MLTVLNVAYPLAPVGVDAVGGAEQVLSALDAALIAAGHRSLVLACEGSRVSGELIAVRTPQRTITPSLQCAIQQEYRTQTNRIVQRERVDVVHLHGVDFHAYLPGPPVPVVATLHLPPSWYPAQLWTLRRPLTYLNCVSAAQKAAAPACPNMLEEIPNGVDLSRLRPNATRSDFAMVLGRICPEKGIHHAIDAAQEASVPLLIAGEAFPYPEHIRYFHQEIEPRIGGTVHYIGPIGLEKKAALLGKARCLLIPSLVPETSSLVAMEAMACGAPVVAFSIGALPSIVADGHNGFVVDNVHQMAVAIHNCSRISSEACRAHAEIHFSQSRMTERYCSLYGRIARSAEAHRSQTRQRMPDLTEQLSVEEITDLSNLQQVHSEWLDLWHRSPRATVFQRPEWLLAWCEHLLCGQLCAVLVRRNGVLIALAPFFRWQARGVRTLSLLGSGVSDYLDIVVDANHELNARERLTRWLSTRAECDRLEWSELRLNSPLLPIGRRVGADPEFAAQQVCPGLSLRDGASAAEHFGAGRWRNVERARRRLQRHGEVKLLSAATAPDVNELSQRLLELHQARWQSKGEAAAPVTQDRLSFLRQAATDLAGKRALSLSGLQLNGELIAVLCGFLDRGTLRLYLSGMAPNFAHCSPGVLLLAATLQTALETGLNHVDFLRGAEAYKYAWGATDLGRVYRWVAWLNSQPAAPAERNANFPAECQTESA